MNYIFMTLFYDSGETVPLRQLSLKIKSKIEKFYSEEDSRIRVRRKTPCDLFVLLAFGICLANYFLSESVYSFVMLLFTMFFFGCSLGFKFRKSILAPSIAFETATIFLIIYLLIFGMGNLFSLLWLIVLTYVAPMYLNHKKATTFLFAILILMLVLYFTPLFRWLSMPIHPLFGKWGIVLIYFVFMSIGIILEIDRYFTIAQLEESKKEMWQLCSYDDLTHIMNRRSFNTALTKLWNDPLHQNLPVSLLMIDIDNFKLFNDNYGHIQGDKALTRIAMTIQNIVTDSKTTLARFGGEEFVVLMPNTNTQMATALAEQIKEAISSLGLRYFDSAVAKTKTLSVSIGVASEELYLLDSAEALIRIADDNLYCAKRNGKNAVWSSLHNEIQS